MYVCSLLSPYPRSLSRFDIFLDNQIIILKVVTTKSIVKAQLNTHTFHIATVITSYKFKEIERKSCVVIQLCQVFKERANWSKEQHKIIWSLATNSSDVSKEMMQFPIKSVLWSVLSIPKENNVQFAEDYVQPLNFLVLKRYQRSVRSSCHLAHFLQDT